MEHSFKRYREMKELLVKKSEKQKTLKKSRLICEKITLRTPEKPFLAYLSNFEAVGHC